MTKPANEQYALAVLGLPGDSTGYKLTNKHGISFDDIDALQRIASTGERAMLDLATSAWRNEGMFGTLAKVDFRTAVDLYAAFIAAYGSRLGRLEGAL